MHPRPSLPSKKINGRINNGGGFMDAVPNDEITVDVEYQGYQMNRRQWLEMYHETIKCFITVDNRTIIAYPDR